MQNHEYVGLFTSDLNIANKMLQTMKKYGDNKWWISEDRKRMAYYQLLEDTLLIEFEVFHKALEELLERPVFTHELGMNHAGLLKEAEKKFKK